jgi:20S proteasome subunit beta 2
MSPHGNSMHVPYTSMGSGSLAALSILENRYKDNMSESEAIELAADAIQAGIFYDLGSGSNINVFSVGRKKCDKLYNYRVFNKKEFNDPSLFDFPQGTTPVLEKTDYKWKDIKLDYESVQVSMEI